MELIINPDVKSVLEFMQDRIPACRLVAIAESLPSLAKLLWDRYPQEPSPALTLELLKLRSPSQPSASESGLGLPCADDGFVAARDGQ